MVTRNTTRRAPHEVLPFERPILELENTITTLEERGADTKRDLGSQVKALEERLGDLVEDIFSNLSPWERVQVARAPGRPLALDYVEHLCDEFLELHGDRAYRDDAAILTAFARIGKRRCLVVAHRKGRDAKENIRVNFGCAHPEGYRKALRKMRLAEKFGLPILCLINTPGAYPGIGAEERGQAWAIAENLMAMFALKVPIIAIVIGEGGSGGALGIGIGDRVLMLEHAYYSVISPEGCAAILWKDAKRADEAASALRLSAPDLFDLGIIDEIVPEPNGAAHRDPMGTINAVGARIEHHLAELEKLSVDRLLEERSAKFRRMGTLFAEAPDLEQPPEAPPAEAEGSKEGSSS